MKRKTNPSYKNLSSGSDDSNKSYQVEKIVNQRMINGKKQFKVIWAGYSFQEATWEPEENLKCKEKIDEFLRRYQDVIKRKMMNKQANSQKISPQGQKPLSVQKQPIVDTSKLNPPAKVTINISSQKNSQNKPVQKSDSISKVNSSVVVKNIQIQKLKSKIMNPVVKQLPATKQTPLPRRIQIQKKKALQQPKAKKTPSSSEQQTQPPAKPTKPSSKSMLATRSKPQIQPSSSQSSLNQQQKDNIFINVKERLHVEQILGVMDRVDQNGDYMFFVVRNRYSKEEKLVERARLIAQCPQILVQFYQTLIVTD